MRLSFDTDHGPLLRPLSPPQTELVEQALANVTRWQAGLSFTCYERLVGSLVAEMGETHAFAAVNLPVLRANIDTHIAAARLREEEFSKAYYALKRQHAWSLYLRLQFKQARQFLQPGIISPASEISQKGAMIKLINARHADDNFWRWLIHHRQTVDETLPEILRFGLFTVEGDWLRPQVSALTEFCADNVPRSRRVAA